MTNNFDNLLFDEAALQKGVSVSLCTIGEIVYGPVVSFFDCFDRTVYGGLFFIRAGENISAARSPKTRFHRNGVELRAVMPSVFARLAIWRL